MFNYTFHRAIPYLTVLSLFLLFAVSIPVLAENEEVQWGVSIEDSMTEAVKTGKPVMMDFYTDW